LAQLAQSLTPTPAPAPRLPPPVAGPPPRPAPPPDRRPGGKPQVLPGNLFGSLLEAVPDALVIIDQTGAIVLVNSQTEQICGYRREALLGRPVEVLIPERFRVGHVAQREAYFRAPRTRPMGQERRLFGRRKDGHEFPVEISLSPMKTADGLLVIGTVR